MMAQAGCLRQLYCSLQSVCQNVVSNPSLHFLLQKSHTKEPRLLLYLSRGFSDARVKSESQVTALEKEQNMELQMQNREHHLRVRRHNSNTYRPDLRAQDSKRNKTNGWADTFGTFQEDTLEERIKESLTCEVATHDER